MNDDHPSPNEPWLRWGLVAYAVVVFTMTHTPLPAPLQAGGISYDKPLHVGAYGVLCLLALRWRRACGGRGWRTRWAVLGGVAAFAALDELTQPLANRVCDPYDWLADLLGGVLAIVFDWWRSKPSPGRPHPCPPAD